MTAEKNTLIVVGGGAAGMMAAITAARLGVHVRLLEQNAKVGRKLYITGKGRCNVTNRCTVQEALDAIPHNGRFLHSAIYRMSPANVERFFHDLGVELKAERGNRVFPKSDRAADVIDALFFELRRLGVDIVQVRADNLVCRDGVIVGVDTEQGRLLCQAVILATGGLSYPATGSTGDGHRMARAVGHTVVQPRASLVALESNDAFCGRMQGLSLKNALLTVKNQKGKLLYKEQGELLFTHFGISGPLALSASAHMRGFGADRYTCFIDLKPALDVPTLDARLVRELSAGANKDMANLIGSLVPKLMGPVMLELAEIPEEKKARDVTKGERRRLLELLKKFTVSISGPRPIAEAIITSGGVRVEEVDPKTMSSKLVDGLFFAGELLDTDAYTGGFNLQIAWATGWAAGDGGAQYLLHSEERPAQGEI